MHKNAQNLRAQNLKAQDPEINFCLNRQCQTYTRYRRHDRESTILPRHYTQNYTTDHWPIRRLKWVNRERSAWLASVHQHRPRHLVDLTIVNTGYHPCLSCNTQTAQLNISLPGWILVRKSNYCINDLSQVVDGIALTSGLHKTTGLYWLFCELMRKIISQTSDISGEVIQFW